MNPTEKLYLPVDGILEMFSSLAGHHQSRITHPSLQSAALIQHPKVSNISKTGMGIIKAVKGCWRQHDKRAIASRSSSSGSRLVSTDRLPKSAVDLLDLGLTKPQNCHRIVVLGAPKVGKTNIIHRFLGEEFEEHYEPTTEDFLRKLFHIRGEAYQTDFLDAPRERDFPAKRRLSILTGQESELFNVCLEIFNKRLLLLFIYYCFCSCVCVSGIRFKMNIRPRCLKELLSPLFHLITKYVSAGDIFLLVFSLDDRASFNEACELLNEIKVAKAKVLKSKNPAKVPVVICGNKVDLDAQRVVSRSEVGEIFGENVPFFEASAKDGTGLENVFRALAILGGLPEETSPSRHQIMSILSYQSLCMDQRGRKEWRTARGQGVPCAAVDPLARRPSFNSDLRVVLGSSTKHNKPEKCQIQ